MVTPVQPPDGVDSVTAAASAALSHHHNIRQTHPFLSSVTRIGALEAVSAEAVAAFTDYRATPMEHTAAGKGGGFVTDDSLDVKFLRIEVAVHNLNAILTEDK